MQILFLSYKGPKKHLERENICFISKDKIDISSLPQLPRIFYKTDPLLKKVLDEWWVENYSTPPLTAMEVDNSRTCVKMVSEGLGYAILPRYCVKTNEDLHIENIHYKDGRLLTRDTWLIYHEKDKELSTVREFVTFMEENVKSLVT